MKEFRAVIAAVSARHRMYVIGDSFWTVAAWIDGYGQGSEDCAGRQQECLHRNGFAQWVAARYGDELGLGPNYAWSVYVHRLAGSDEAAIRMLPRLYDEFLASRVDGTEMKQAPTAG